MTRRLAIPVAVALTGLSLSCHVANGFRYLRRTFAHRRHLSPLPAPLTTDQLERARHAMDDLDLWGDASTYRRQH